MSEGIIPKKGGIFVEVMNSRQGGLSVRPLQGAIQGLERLHGGALPEEEFLIYFFYGTERKCAGGAEGEIPPER
jgi:hypothetical protein